MDRDGDPLLSAKLAAKVVVVVPPMLITLTLPDGTSVSMTVREYQERQRKALQGAADVPNAG